MSDKLTKEQAVIISGFTKILCCDFSDLHEEIEKRFGRPVLTHEIPFLMDDISDLFRDDFLALCHSTVVTMKIKNGDMPAMPTQANGGDVYGGLTKREQFAMAAMQGLLAMGFECQGAPEDMAAHAVVVADALLAELARG